MWEEDFRDCTKVLKSVPGVWDKPDGSQRAEAE